MIERLAGIGILFLAAGAWSPGVSAQDGYYFHCWYRAPAHGAPGGTVYSSGVFSVTSPEENPINDWNKYIRVKFGLNADKNSGICERFGARAAQQQNSLGMEKKNWAAEKLKIVDVDYEAGDGEIVGPPDLTPLMASMATAAEASPSTQHRPVRPANLMYYYCSSEQGATTIYFSGAFDTMDQTSTTMTAAFKAFLKAKYSFDSESPVCFGNYTSIGDVQTEEQKRMATMRDSKKWKVIDTGWTYVP
jgi:hypothetical protein